MTVLHGGVIESKGTIRNSYEECNRIIVLFDCIYYTSIVLLFDNISIVYDRDPNIGLVFEERFFSIELFCCCSDCFSIAMLIRDL